MSAHHRESPAVQDWIARANAANILDVAKGGSIQAALKRCGSEWIGACVACGGNDRFSVNARDGVWNCRGAEGGKGAISLAMHALSCDFLTAVETITGERRPDGVREESAEDREARETRNRKLAAESAARAAKQVRAEAARRERDDEAVADVLARAVPILGTRGEAYLRDGRGLRPAKRLLGDVKFVAALEFWGTPEGGAAGDPKRLIASLPAMVAIIRDVTGAVIGIHKTYLDPREPKKWVAPWEAALPKAKRLNPPKKIRGDAKGGMIRLGIIGEALAISEGLETALAWHSLGYGPEDISLSAAVSLGNLCGSATGPFPHPTLKGPDGKPTKIRNGIPDMARPGVILPADVRTVYLIGDGDSEPYATSAAMLTALRRFKNEGRECFVHMAPDGKDFADLALEQSRELEKAA